MEVKLDCVQCTLRQAVEAGRLATSDYNIRKEIVLKSLDILLNFESYKTPPEMGRAIHNLVMEYTGNDNPYKKMKDDAIRTAHSIYPGLKEFVRAQNDTLRSALEVSALGNLLDAAVYGEIQLDGLEERLEKELIKGLGLGGIEILRKELEDAKIVMIIGDNAGETVLDRILISEIKRIGGDKTRVFYTVRNGPIVNDATMEDAIASGLDSDATIIDTGSSVAGLLLNEVSPEFLKPYYNADVVISKGQGNYETLSESKGRVIYFLLKVKCRAVAEDIGANLEEYVLLRK